LHQHAVNKQRVLQEKIEINNQIKDEKEVEGCTFQPNIFTNDKDVQKVREESFYEGIPNGFKVST